MNIRKRDGAVVPFDIGKIKNAVLKALEAVGMPSESVAERVAKDAAKALKSEEEPTVEQIQDVVRAIILSYGRIDGTDWPIIKNRIKDELHRFIYDKIKRNPMILPIIVDLG